MLILLSLVSLPAMGAETAEELLQKCSSKLNSANTLKAKFSMTEGGKQWTGEFLSKGAKFSIVMPGAGTWYDGKDIWNYSKTSGEATVWKPTKAELAESNPFLYISTSSNYNVKFGSSSNSGEKTLVLTPKTRGNSVKSVTIKINASTLLPKSFVISASGGTYTINVSSISLNQSISDDSFKFNKGKYPGVVVSDLR